MIHINFTIESKSPPAGYKCCSTQWLQSLTSEKKYSCILSFWDRRKTRFPMGTFFSPRLHRSFPAQAHPPPCMSDSVQLSHCDFSSQPNPLVLIRGIRSHRSYRKGKRAFITPTPSLLLRALSSLKNFSGKCCEKLLLKPYCHPQVLASALTRMS